MNTDLINKIILLADDDHDDAEMFELVMSEVDVSIKVNHVNNGATLLEYFRKGNFADVIFLDINMPEMNGWQCLKRLKDHPVAKDIPVIIYTTSSHPRDKEIAKERGASGFV